MKAKKKLALILIGFICICVVVLLIIQLPTLSPFKHQAKGSSVDVWLTTGDQAHLLELQAPLHFDSIRTDKAFPSIDIRENETHQTIDGFGAAITGSSAYLINQKLNTEQQDLLLKELFTPQGINIGFVRHTIGASDFNVDGSYTYDDVESGADYDLKHFSIEKDADVIKVLQKSLALHKDLKILGSPWSAPAWMKTGQELNAGSLNMEDTQIMPTYANYFVKYIATYKEQGIPIYAITP
ncbi:MAG: hypothetical protein K6T85_10930, partial [Gorillibacterium sp.]|nr:hypothetical protein [Gorillibacterium sp.]